MRFHSSLGVPKWASGVEKGADCEQTAIDFGTLSRVMQGEPVTSK